MTRRPAVHDREARQRAILEQLAQDAELAELRTLDDDATAARAALRELDARGPSPELAAALTRLAQARAAVERAEKKLADARGDLTGAWGAHGALEHLAARERAALARRAYPDHQLVAAREALEAEVARDPGHDVHRGRIGAYRAAVARELGRLRPLLTNAVTNGLPDAASPAEVVLDGIAAARVLGEVAVAASLAETERARIERWNS